MKRLFVRFYLGVLVILVAAWSIQAFVFSRAFRDAGRPFEDVFAGGLRSARAIYEDAGADSATALASLQELFEYPIAEVLVAELPPAARDRLSAGEDVALIAQDGFYLAVKLSDGSRTLKIGPYHGPRGPSQLDLLLGMGAILVLAAGAIAVLLRPISRQLRRLEETAEAIAGGNFAVRVDDRKVPSARTLAIAMNEMAARTQSLLNSQREIFQAVSHELRTPLSRIEFAIDLLRRETQEEQRTRRLAALASAAAEMDRLVSELLHYVRWEASPPANPDEEIELLPFVEAVLQKLTALYPAKRFSIGQGLQSSGAVMRCDRFGMDCVLGNLLANAGRFAERRIAIDCAETAAGFAIDVDDDGPGIPQPDRQRVFDTFVRLDSGGRGAGLGLSLVRRIIGHHGGAVVALESPLGGCRIRVTLPMERLKSSTGRSADQAVTN